MVKKIPRKIDISIRGISGDFNLKGIPCSGMTTWNKVNRNKIEIIWNMSGDSQPRDTVMHELVHALEVIFIGNSWEHTRRFKRVLKYLKKEFKC